MSPEIIARLAEPGSGWVAAEPASQEAIGTLHLICPHAIPAELMELWRYSNGGEAEDLALPPLQFSLDPIESVIESLKEETYGADFWNIVFFGSNGGSDLIGLDYRHKFPPRIVMLDPADGIKEAEIIAQTIAEFINAIGKPYKALD